MYFTSTIKIKTPQKKTDEKKLLFFKLEKTLIVFTGILTSFLIIYFIFWIVSQIILLKSTVSFVLFFFLFVLPSSIFSIFSFSILKKYWFSSKKNSITKTTITILEILNRIFEKMNISSIVKFSKDNSSYALPKNGANFSDLIARFKHKIQNLELIKFDNLEFVFKHSDENLKYLIEIKVNKKFYENEYPFIITINAMSKLFSDKNLSSVSDFKIKFRNELRTQEKYDDFVNNLQINFEEYIFFLKENINHYLKPTEMNEGIEVTKKIIRPLSFYFDFNQIKYRKTEEPIFHGYSGYDKQSIFSLFLWGDLMCENNIYCNNSTLVDAFGIPFMEVGNRGFYAGEFNTLNTNKTFEKPKGEVYIHIETNYISELLDLKFYQRKPKNKEKTVNFFSDKIQTIKNMEIN